jgi:chromosome segregation ATPase
MAKKQIKKEKRGVTFAEAEKMMSRQTGIILDAFDNRFQKVEYKIDSLDDRMAAIEKRMDLFEKSMDELRNTLDKFLKRLMDFNDEFKIVKARLAKVEKILREKLGVAID